MHLKKIVLGALFLTSLCRADTGAFARTAQELADVISLSAAKTVITGYLSFVAGGAFISDLDHSLIIEAHPELEEDSSLWSNQHKLILGSTYAGLLALTQYVDENSSTGAQCTVKIIASFMLTSTMYWALPILSTKLYTKARALYGNIKEKLCGAQNVTLC